MGQCSEKKKTKKNNCHNLNFFISKVEIFLRSRQTENQLLFVLIEGS